MVKHEDSTTALAMTAHLVRFLVTEGVLTRQQALQFFEQFQEAEPDCFAGERSLLGTSVREIIARAREPVWR